MPRLQFFVGILSAVGYTERRKACLDTWVGRMKKRCDMDVVFVLGNPKLASPRRENHLLWCPCPDDYSHLSQKTKWLVDWAVRNAAFDYLLKCDDDTYVAVDRLAASKLGASYIGHDMGGFASGGAGYLLSRRAAELLAGSTLGTGCAEDVLVSEALQRQQICLFPDSRFYPWQDITPRWSNRQITAHYIDPVKMRRIHDRFALRADAALDRCRDALPRMHTNYAALAEFASTLQPSSLIVEIGAFAGELTEVLLEEGMHVHSVDPWNNDSRDRLYEGLASSANATRPVFDISLAEAAFDSVAARFPGTVIKLKGHDTSFVDSYSAESIDAVYIDSVHTYAETLATIRRWLPKIRRGGRICGHDYAEYFPGVMQAVNEAFGRPQRLFGDSTWMVGV